MKYFNPAFLKFFEGLASNNHKDWFDANRKTYDQSVRKPFKAFVEDLIQEMRKSDPNLKLEAKDAIFRINRDIRFSKDKTPYKTHMGAVISPLGKKDKTNPGVYIQMSAEDFRIYGGIYMLSTAQLKQVRQYMMDHSQSLEEALNAADFCSHYGGEIHGEKAKRLPKEMQAFAEQQPLMYNKSFYYFTKLPADSILSDELMKTVLQHYYAAQPVRAFFQAALNA